jgi:hypothetical protein
VRDLERKANTVSASYPDRMIEEPALPRNIFVSECYACKIRGVIRWAKVEWLIGECEPDRFFYRYFLCSRHLDIWLDNADDDPGLEPTFVFWLYENQMIGELNYAS